MYNNLLEFMPILLHDQVEFHTSVVSEWVDSKGRLYKSLKYISEDAAAKEWHTKNKAMWVPVQTDTYILERIQRIRI